MIFSFFRQRMFTTASCVLLVTLALCFPLVSQPAHASASIVSRNTQRLAGSQSAQFIVSSTVQWVDTGITLSAGNTLNITAAGSWSADPTDGFTTPDGYTQPVADNFLNLSDIGACASCASTPMPNWGALIGYIGNTPPAAGSYTSTSVLADAQKVFVVGSNFQSSTKPAGRLWLNFNDDAYSGYTTDNAGQVTAVVTATAPKPGGMWITKTGFNAAVGKNFTFQAYAYPTNKATDPAIAHVNFTATWPGHGWVDICGNVTRHSSSNVYSCSTDFTKLNGGILVPQGSITVTFNVTDTQGNVNDAPNGSLSGKINSPLLNVSYISQFQNQPTYAYDCGPTSVAMSLYYTHRIPTLNGTAITSARNATGTKSGDTNPTQLETALKFYKQGYSPIKSSIATSNMITTMVNALKQGHPSIILIDANVKGSQNGLNRSYPVNGGHYILLVGTSPDGKTFYVNDPDNLVNKPGINGGPNLPLSMTTLTVSIDAGKKLWNGDNVITMA